jgi:hypothetical protein
MSRFEAPSAAISMILARCARRASIIPERVQDSKMSWSPRHNLSGGSYMGRVNQISVISAWIH